MFDNLAAARESDEKSETAALNDGAPDPKSPAVLAAFALVPGRRQRLGDQLYGQILDQIVSGRLKQGDRLPPETEICEMFGVSRPIVREALIRLRADGLVQARQGAGTFVINRPATRLTSFAESRDVASFLRCIEARMPLEGAAARLAAERRTTAQMAAITDAHAAFQQETEAGTMSAATDLAFHAGIAAAAGNAFFPALLQTLNEALTGFMTLSLNLTRTGSRERAHQVLYEHGQVTEAIRAQDAEAAQIAMQFHIGQARRRMIDRDRDL